MMFRALRAAEQSATRRAAGDGMSDKLLRV